MPIITIITEDQKDEICRLYTQDKVTIVHLLNQFRVRADRIKDILIERGITQMRKNNGYILSQKQELEICTLYDNGMKMTVINELFCIGKRRFNKILQKHNIRKRTRTEQIRQYKIDESYFERIDTVDKAYWFGWMCADGTNRKELNGFAINLNVKDTEALEKFKACLKSEHPIQYVPSHNQNKLTISSVKMSRDLKNLGCIPNKSLVFELPRHIKEELFHHFVRGIFDGDGCISNNIRRNRTCLRYNVDITGSIPFIRQLTQLLKEKLNISIDMRIIKGRYARLATCSYKSGIRFLDWMYKDCGDLKLSRKYNRYQQMKEHRDELFIQYKILYPKGSRIMK